MKSLKSSLSTQNRTALVRSSTALLHKVRPLTAAAPCRPRYGCHHSRRAHSELVTASGQANVAALESKSLLEWPAICNQVASFCRTVMGAQLILGGELPEGGSAEACEVLMQQTSEALVANISFEGAFDLRPALEAAETPGFILNGQQLYGFLTTLQCAFDAREVACRVDEDGAPAFPALADLAVGISTGERPVLAAIRKCIQLGEVTDAASEKLAEVRAERRVNLEELRRVVEGAAAAMKAIGASEEGSTSIIRDRFCLGIKAGRQGELGRGAVRLGSSASGATMYMEPPLAVALNNQEAILKERQQQEETAVLALLTQLVRERSVALYRLVDSLAALDIASARGHHAHWLGATRPAIRRSSGAAASSSGRAAAGTVSTSSTVNHNALGTTTAGSCSMHVNSSGTGSASRNVDDKSSGSDNGNSTVDDNSSVTTHTSIGEGGGEGIGAGASRSGAAAVTADAASVAGPVDEGTSDPTAPSRLLHAPGARHPVLMQPALARLPMPPSGIDNRFDRNFQEAPSWEKVGLLANSAPPPPRTMPRALDLRIPPSKTVVAITGPNTGGKTATLKTLGVLALMAKAGLFWPCEQADIERHGPPYVHFFDQVLADLGDSQSLEQNLSTFSGHIRRVRQILQAATSKSLVLLDEVGSGTDPVEGAALARAVLDVLAQRAALTVATTHHAELKTAESEDVNYCNVSMEFDTKTLSPTYQLQWGTAGASNALDIALALGFDSSVVSEARNVVGHGEAVLATGVSESEVVEKLKAQLSTTQAAAGRARAAGRLVRTQVAAMRTELQQLQQQKEKLKGWEVRVNQDKMRIGRELDTAVQQYAAGMIGREEVEEAFRKANKEVLKTL